MTTTKVPKRPAPTVPKLSKPERTRSGGFRAYVWDSHRQEKVWATNPDNGSQIFEVAWEAQAAQLALYHRMTEVYACHSDPLTARKQLRHPFPEVAREWLAAKEKEPGKRGAKERGGTPQTIRARRSAVNVLCRAFPREDIREVDQDRFLDFLEGEEEKDLASATIESRVVYMRQIVDYAQRKGYCEDNCTEGISVMVEREKDLRYLTDQEQCLLSCHVPVWFFPALLLAYDCGLRAAEVAGLRWMRLDLDAKVSRVVIKDVMEPDKTLRAYPKGKTTQSVSLTPRCIEALRVLQQWRPDDAPEDFVFRNVAGTTMDPSEPSRIIKAVWGLLGLDGVRPTFHALRHSCATNLAEAGAPMEVIMERMRHKNPAVTMKYIRRSLERQAEWAARVQDAADAVVISLYNERKARRDTESGASVEQPVMPAGDVVISRAEWEMFQQIKALMAAKAA